MLIEVCAECFPKVLGCQGTAEHMAYLDAKAVAQSIGWVPPMGWTLGSPPAGDNVYWVRHRDDQTFLLRWRSVQTPGCLSPNGGGSVVRLGPNGEILPAVGYFEASEILAHVGPIALPPPWEA